MTASGCRTRPSRIGYVRRSVSRPLVAPARAALALALVAGGAGAQEVPLRFAWPVGTEARVTLVHTRHEEDGVGGSRDGYLEGEYRLRVRGHPRGVLLDFSDYQTTAFDMKPEPDPLDPTPELIRRLGVFTPDYVVSSGGDLLEVTELEAAAATIREVLQPLYDTLATIPDSEAVVAMMESLTSGEQLRVQTEDAWLMQTGLWSGLTLVPGRPLEVQGDAPTPVAPERPIPFVHRLTLAGAVPCHEGEAALRCVRLEMRSEADPRGLERTIREVLRRMGVPESVGIPIENLRHQRQVTVVADPATLLPHSVEVSSDLEGDMKNGSITMPYRQQERGRLEYVYIGG